MDKLFSSLNPFTWIVLVQGWYYETSAKEQAFISSFWCVLREATLYVLDLFKVLQFDWMAGSVITFYNLYFMWEIRVDWEANQI